MCFRRRRADQERLPRRSPDDQEWRRNFARRHRLRFKGAITATAHKLARYVYAMLKHGEAYVSQSLQDYEAATQQRIERTLRKKARALGYDLVPTQPTSPAVS